MDTQTVEFDSFNGWQMLANLAALLGLALLPYLVWIGVVVYQQF